MSWAYEISTGRMYYDDGSLLATGYSGQPPHVNDLAAVGERGIGPIPPGSWQLTGVEDSPRTGPFTIILTPDAATMLSVLALGRDPNTLRIHGERETPPPGYASDGCVVLPHEIRKKIWDSGDHYLDTIATLEEEPS